MINELLRRYVAERSEPAFAELVRHHIDLVYSAALRQVNGDAATAQDVTQAVFTDLARKAARLTGHTSLTGWLYTSTRYLAAKALRAEQRRRAREQGAYAMNQILHSNDPDPAWHELRPLLDDVMHELNAADREAVLMRYFERLPLAQVGARLGLSENTARMKVERALDKLRAALARRGVTSTLAALTALLAERAVGAAPAGLAVQVGHASFAAGAGSAVSWLSFLGSLKAKLLAAAGAAALVTGLLILPQQWKAPHPAAVASTPAVAQARTNAAQASTPPRHTASTQEDASATSNKLVLHLVAADSGKPIPSVLVEYTLLDGTNSLHQELWSTRFGRCDVPVPRDIARNFLLWTKTDGFADTWLNWRTDRGDQIPREYTLRLARAVKIGGLVLDANGHPVADAYVAFSTPSGLAALEQARPEARASTGIGTTSGPEGRWSLSRIAPEIFHRSQGAASHPEHASSPRISLEASPETEKQLLAGAYVFRLGRAVTAQGLIVDSQGQPVPEARVLLCALLQSFSVPGAASPLRSATNNTDGAFVVPGCVPGTNQLSVEAEGFARAELLVDLETNSAPLRVILERGHLLKLRVVDQRGRPVPGATVELSSATNVPSPGMPPPRTGSGLRAALPQESNWLGSRQTDSTGWLVWAGAPSAEVTCQVTADGFAQASGIQVKADGQEHLVTLASGLTLSGSVREAATGKPITHFRIIRGSPRWRASMGSPLWQRAEDVPWISSPDGTFRQGVREPYQPDPALVFKFEAEGYAPQVTRPVQANEGEVRLDITLRASTSMTLTVLAPDGRPAAHADVGLVAPGAQIRLRPGSLCRGNTYPPTESVPTTDARGQLVLSPEDNVMTVIAASQDGYAEAAPASLGSPPTLQLQPWGRIEGTVLSAGKPAPNRRVRFEYGAAQRNTISADLLDYQTTTDQEGRFVFPKVPPGKHKVGQMIPATPGGFGAGSPPAGAGRLGMAGMFARPSGSVDVEVRPGETASATLGASGYTVTARLSWPADFKQDAAWVPRVMLQARRTRPSGATQADPQTAVAPRPRLGVSPAPFLLTPDGTWVADSVAPGDYIVSASLTERGQAGAGMVVHATGQASLTVPSEPAAGTLDLGEIPMRPGQ